MLHIGVDEAGYGPLLGPLVVAAASYETDAPRAELTGPGVADSKIVYGRGGRAALLRVLGPYLGFEGRLPLGGLLERLSVRGDPRPGYDWYGEVDEELPETAAPAPGEFRRLYLNPVCEREFNAGCAETGGKALLLFRESMRVVKAALADAPDLPAEVVCDKHGARNRYAALLLEGLEPASLVPEREAADESSYRLVVGGRPVRISFRKRADGSDLPAALASMAAKLLRELFMRGLNEFFAARVEGLRPTAGYVEDGRRFLAEVEGALGELGGLVRER